MKRSGYGRDSSNGAWYSLRTVVATLGFIGTFVTQSAMAAPLTETTVGLKLLAGAEIWSAPSDVPSLQQGLGFTGSAGGIGYGAMVYYDLRIIKLIGLEVDLAYQHGSFHRNVTQNQVYRLTETVSTNDWRVPILAKLNIPLGLGRLWLGAGPEFTFSQSSSGKLEQTGGPPLGIRCLMIMI